MGRKHLGFQRSGASNMPSTVRLGLAEGLPAGLFVKSMHPSDFLSPARRMIHARTPPLRADHFRLSSLFDLSSLDA
jgi:hypothetical protein